MILELHDIQRSLQVKKSAVEIGVDNLEEGKKVRDIKKKEFLLNEMKQILAKLNEIDKKAVKDLKGDALDFIHCVKKMTDEIAILKDSLKTAPKLDQKESKWKAELITLKARIESLKCEEFVRCLGISVSIQPGTMAAAVEKVSDAILLETPLLSPKHFFLEMPQIKTLQEFQLTNHNPNYVDVRVHIVGEGAPSTFSSFLLQKLVMTLDYQVPGDRAGTRVIEECSVWSKIEKRKAVVSEDGTCITVQVKRPNYPVGKISIHFLESNIVNSPILHQFWDYNEKNRDLTSHNLTTAKDNIDIFGTTSLDKSGRNSLGMAVRRQMFLAADKKHDRASVPEKSPNLVSIASIAPSLQSSWSHGPECEGDADKRQGISKTML